MPTYNWACRDCGFSWTTKEIAINCPKCNGYTIYRKIDKPLVWR